MDSAISGSFHLSRFERLLSGKIGLTARFSIVLVSYIRIIIGHSATEGISFNLGLQIWSENPANDHCLAYKSSKR
jgi:hypothetical protein